MGTDATQYRRISVAAAIFLAWISGINGCAGPEVAPPPIMPPQVPPLVQAPHPAGSDLGDLSALFLTADSPKPEMLKSCDTRFLKLQKLAQSRDEMRYGTRELVRRDPVSYHWCFYGKVLELEQQLKLDQYVDERQKHVLETFQFLVPLARAFQAEFKDSRYLRYAIQRYRQLSERVFFRSVEITPQTSSELVVLENPFGLWRNSEDGFSASVLDKYGIDQPDVSKLSELNAPENLRQSADDSEEPERELASDSPATAPAASQEKVRENPPSTETNSKGPPDAPPLETE